MSFGLTTSALSKASFHNAKDSCRMFNFLKSKEAEAIGLAPIAPYIAEEGQLEGHTKTSGTTRLIRLKLYLSIKASLSTAI
jgi:hypothetical protein